MSESHQGFDSIATIPDAVADILRQTMVFGLPVDDRLKPTFYFDKVVEWEKHDSEGNPWDWNAAPDVETQRNPIKPICAYEFFAPLGRQGDHPTEAGDFNPTTLLVTMFEDEWRQVRGFSHVTVGPSSQKFSFRFWRPSYALGHLPVIQSQCSAEGLV